MNEDQPLTKREKRQLAKEHKMEERLKVEQTNKTRNWIGGLLIIGLILWGGMKLWQWINMPTGYASEIFQIKPDDHVKGDASAQITLFEYGDYQCPACAYFAPEIEKLLADYEGEVKFVYRHFPLVSIHKNAISAAKAAEAAGLQGKYWEMHLLLYDKQLEWEEESNPKDKFVEYAGSMGLDIEKFKTDYDSDQVSQKVNADLTQANSLGLTSTPTFFINGVKLKNPKNYDDFKAMIEKYME